MDKSGKMKIKVIKPYIVIRPGKGEQLIKGTITMDTEKAEKLIESGRAIEVVTVPKKQKQSAKVKKAG